MYICITELKPIITNVTKNKAVWKLRNDIKNILYNDIFLSWTCEMIFPPPLQHNKSNTKK